MAADLSRKKLGGAYFMCNADVREHAKASGVYLYQVAAAMGISEPTMTRKLRFELSRSEKQKLIAVIDHLKPNKNTSR